MRSGLPDLDSLDDTQHHDLLTRAVLALEDIAHQLRMQRASIPFSPVTVYKTQGSGAWQVATIHNSKQYIAMIRDGWQQVGKNTVDEEGIETYTLARQIPEEDLEDNPCQPCLTPNGARS